MPAGTPRDLDTSINTFDPALGTVRSTLRSRTGMFARSAWGWFGFVGLCLLLFMRVWPDETATPQNRAPEPEAEPNSASTVALHGEYLTSLAASPDGNTVVAASLRGSAKIWDRATGAVRDLSSDPTSHLGFRALAFAPDGSTLAALSFSGQVWLWDMRLEEPRPAFSTGREPARCICFAADSKSLYVGGGDRSLELWDLPSSTVVTSFPSRMAETSALTLSPDGRCLAAGNRRGTIALIDPRTGQEQTVLQERGNAVLQLRLSHDNRTLASTSNLHRHATIWDLGTGRERARLGLPNTIATAVALSPDGRTVATGHGAGLIRLWDLATAREILTLRGHRSWINALAFSPDGKTLYSGGSDSLLKAWDLGKFPSL